jgi:hypothetical protein
MIKKLLSIVALTVATNGAVNAQSQFVVEQADFNPANKSYNTSVSANEKTSAITAQDTLWYFYKKHVYRNNSTNQGFYTVNSPDNFAVTNHVGSRFANTGTVVVTGLEGIAARKGSSTSASVTARLYLCNVTAGLPVLPPLDSVSAVLTGTGGVFFGGNFMLPKIVTGDFAVLIRSGYTAGDTIRPYMNNANTASSTTTLTSCKFGEGFGYYRSLSTGNFTTTTGAYGLPTTGGTSDCEFMVAPRVSFSLTANATAPTTVCTNSSFNFTNTTSAWATNRQFNYNQFHPYWVPFANTITPVPASIYVWTFGDGSPTSTVTSPSKTYTTSASFSGNLTLNYTKLSAVKSNSVLATTTPDVKTWTVTSSVCTGLKSNTLNANVVVFPNPAVNGKLTISNLEGANTITVYNMLGSVISTQTSSNTNVLVDLSNQAIGNYFVKITDSNSNTKTIKVINQ